MDIKERVLSVGAAEQAAADRQRQQQKQRWYRYFLSPLWVILLLTLLLRVWLIVRTQGFIDGDEALLGIQAEKILQGIFPIYFYGQPYMGSLSAYLTAIIFAIAGPSTWAMRAEPALLSLLMLALTWKFAGLLAEVANLPLYARKYFVIVATLLAAIPPLYDGVIELRTFGGYIETFVLMLLLLISALQLPRRWQAGASSRELALRWAGIGFVVGLGMWVYPLIVSAILAAALWIAAVGAIEIVRQWKQIPAGTKRTFSTIVHSARGILLAVVAIPAAIVGFMPGIIWGATHQWANVAYIASTGGGIGNRLYTMLRIEYVYRTCIVPRVISGALPTESNLMASIHMPLLIAGVFCIAATAALIGLSFLWHSPVLLRIPRLTTLPLLFGVCTAITFITARNSEHTLNAPCASYDPSGRYATPLVLAMPFFFAALFTVISMYLHYRSEKRLQAHMAGALPAGIACGQGEQEGSRSAATTIHAPMATRFNFQLIAQVLLLALLFVYLGAQAATYGLRDETGAGNIFQSPFCQQSLTNDDPIIAYLQQQHVHYGWATNWIGYTIDFKTNGSIIIADPIPFIPHGPNVERIPEYTNAVRHAVRPALLVFVHHDNPYPNLLQALDNASVTYTAARFPASGGSDVLVVTNLSRTVSPFESPAFENSFVSCPG